MNINISSINPFKNILHKIFFIALIAPTFLLASGLHEKNGNVATEDFLLEISKNDVLYEKYDSPKSQFDRFFGFRMNYDNDDQINFDDLSISVDSKNIRELYYRKFETMREDTNKNSNFFYTEKI